MNFVFLDNFKNSMNRQFFFFFFFFMEMESAKRLKIKRMASWKITRENCAIVSKTQLTLALRKYCSNDVERYFRRVLAFTIRVFSLFSLFFFFKENFIASFFLNWQSVITGLWNCQYEGNIGRWIRTDKRL